ncbi:hypothetical protein C8D87_11478 [Lentzea atacamensis]|uniref:Uncharacterized protein n=1 Tax=Lentzea atacamensis TaxID=531938 RepID=A0ABX9DZC7_9PSEU|nr:hypothetical protein [Lentzea atacamensis]RAS59466.1 hypothetical protein C8D87_11478 [Lentzea atacamensis]
MPANTLTGQRRDGVTALLDPLGDRIAEEVALQAVRQAQASLGLLRPPPVVLPLTVIRGQPPPKVVLGYGLGCDSSAILARWLADPSSRDFDLSELAVITGMTGQEWPTTRRLVETHLLPQMTAAGVRYIQVARHGARQADGVDILSDTRAPDRLHLVGAWTLAHEMFNGGTVPQTTGDRLCSQHFKAWPLDTVIAELTQGQPYRHVMGYELGEARRAERDAKYNTTLRTGQYPLREWGWDRARAQAFLRTTFDLEQDWVKSACTYCPFALTTQAGRVEAVARFVAEPDAGVLALAMEFAATALNPTQGLIKGQRLLSLLRASTGTAAVLAAFTELLASLPWAVYDVRRALSPRTDGKANHARSVRILDVGEPGRMRARLDQRARCAGVPVTIGDPAFPDDTHPRAWLRHREPHQLADGTPTGEQFLTIAPATAQSKTGPAFPAAWAAASQLRLTV